MVRFYEFFALEECSQIHTKACERCRLMHNLSTIVFFLFCLCYVHQRGRPAVIGCATLFYQRICLVRIEYTMGATATGEGLRVCSVKCILYIQNWRSTSIH